jgi:uncharacterized membrane protein YhaH (DUF805 family)|tara:strand:+ start:167 stop:547 length:381 start_codon:yes stop_codon:yes gene_type:complete
VNWYLKVVKEHYADFKGRARRKEYWMFTLFNIIFLGVAVVLDTLLGLSFTELVPYGWIYVIYVLAVFIPGIAVVVRRLHDIGKSGWFYFIALIPIIGAIWLLVLLCTDSESGANKWGENPKKTGNE